MDDRFPFPPYPNGWFRAAYTNELSVREIVPLHFFGRDLVLFRDAEGVAVVLDAHCRHLGAHLGYGGKVEGRGIRCPFHAWLWDRDGGCRGLPRELRAHALPPRSPLSMRVELAEGDAAAACSAAILRELGGVDYLVNNAAIYHDMEMHGITQSLARELGPRKIRVNAIAPWPTDTEATRKVVPDAYKKMLLASMPLGRMAQVDEMVGACLFLLSDEASFITAQILAVDGGQIMTV